LDEQVLIETRIDELARLLEAETAELAKLQSIKSGLMDDLLTGRVRVPEAR
jgi:type I restriction enzyme S subunit